MNAFATPIPEQATARLCAHVARIGYDDLDAATVAVVKRLIADGIAVAMAGTREAAAAIVAAHVREQGGAPHATVWGFGCKVAPAAAAYANAVSMHVLDFEPMSNPPTHAVSPTLPAVLALAEARGMDGRAIVTACAKGFEMQGRVLLAARPKRGALPFHTPGVIGLMGSAVAASHLLGLDSAQLAFALGMAASRCSGLPANTGSMVKCTHCGNAAAAGLEAAMLAARGFTAHPGILEAPHGYVATFFPEQFDYEELFAFGQPYRSVDPGMAIKFFPSKFPTHFAIGAALDVRTAIADAAAIRAVRIVTPDIRDANRPQPRGGLEGKFSFQYTASAALLDGYVGIRTFTDERRFRPDMVALLSRTAVEVDPTLPQDTRRMQVTVAVTLADGATVSRTCAKPPGFWGEPVDDAQHAAKLRDCLSARLDGAAIDAVLDGVGRLERLSTGEVHGLMSLLG